MCRDQDCIKSEIGHLQFLDLHQQMHAACKDSQGMVIGKIYSKDKPEDFKLSPDEYHDKTVQILNQLFSNSILE